ARRRFGDERAAADAGRDEALGRKLVVARDHRVAVELERFGELARARQRLAGLQTPPPDVVRDRAREPQEPRLPPAGIERNRELPSAHGGRDGTGPANVAKPALPASGGQGDAGPAPRHHQRRTPCNRFRARSSRPPALPRSRERPRPPRRRTITTRSATR